MRASGPSCRQWLVLHEPEEVRITAEADEPGYVVLADAWYPGWQATVNGEAVPIRRADYLFRAVEVPAGRSEIRFVYRPRSLAWGALVSAAAAVAFLVVAWRGVRRGRAPLFRPPS